MRGPEAKVGAIQDRDDSGPLAIEKLIADQPEGSRLQQLYHDPRTRGAVIRRIKQRLTNEATKARANAPASAAQPAPQSVASVPTLVGSPTAASAPATAATPDKTIPATVVSETGSADVKNPDKPVIPALPVHEAAPASTPDFATSPSPAPEHPAAATTHAQAARMPKGANDPPYDGRKLDDATYLKDYHHLDGGESLYDNPTTHEEAAVLNAVRSSQKRIDPTYLLAWQTAVGVKDNSGAMNTDTLRKFVEHYGAAAITPGAILGGELFRQMAPGVRGDPIIDTGAGWGGGPRGSTKTVGEGKSKADAMAVAAGFANYSDMHKFKHMSLLGFTIGEGQPHLASRVALADSWLSQRHPKAVGNKEVCQSDLGWSTRANGAYSDDPKLIELFGFRGNVAVGPHMHSAGLALDIDAKLNPYVFAGVTNNKHGDTNDIMAKHLRFAAQIYGGERITPDGLAQWSKDMSTEELWARVQEVSQSLGKYLKLAERGDDDEIFHAFFDQPPKGAGMPEAEARANVMSAKHFGKKDSGDRNWKTGRAFQDQVGREQATGLMQHSMDMIVALRDVAGLAWGGTEMSAVENGDFMHFDMRFDGAAGSAVYAFAQNNDVAPADQDHDTKKK